MNLEVQTKISKFFSQYKSKKYTPGEIIIFPNVAPSGVFFIQKGFVHEYGVSMQGVEITIHIFTPKSFFPMMWVISNIENRYYYESLTDTKISIAPKEDVLAFIKANPDVLFSLTDRLLQGLDKLTMRIEGFTSTNAYQKVASTLLFLARHFGSNEGNSIRLSHRFTHRDIGALAGLTRETISREWEKLEYKKILSYKDKYIVIHDMDALKKELT